MSTDKKIPLVEIFGPTISGEGSVIGQQTFFLRFGLCDYKCKMCDSMHAVDPKLVKARARWLTQTEIAEELIAKMGHTQWVTFSGGNPCIHELGLLVELLHNAGKKIAVETQGTLQPSWLYQVDDITVSPKGRGMGEKFEEDVFLSFISLMHKAYFSHPHEMNIAIKVVVFSQLDIEFAVYVRQAIKEHLAGWEPPFFLSCGNPYPTNYNKTPGEQFEESQLRPEAKEAIERQRVRELRSILMDRYAMLVEDIVQNPHLANVKFLPQLHVLAWGTKDGV